MGGGVRNSQKTGFYVIYWRQVHFICLELFKSSRNNCNKQNKNMKITLSSTVFERKHSNYFTSTLHRAKFRIKIILSFGYCFAKINKS